MFEKFRNSSLRNYGICQSYYLSAPALSSDAMLSMTKVELKLISNTDMYLFFEKSIKGGVSYILIFNGYTTTKFLLTDGFKWKNPQEFEMNKYTNNSSKICVLEADIEYPKELKELHNDYPLVSEKIEMKKEMFSYYQLKIDNLYNILIVTVKKLVPNFFECVLHYENLQLYLRLVLKLKNTLRIRIQ